MESAELIRDLLFWTILVLILLVVVFYFIPYIFALSENAQKRVSPSTEEPTEEVVKSRYRSLGILTTDPPEIKVFKLFENFDPLFLNDQSGSKCTAPCIMYNSFILDLAGNTYGYNDVLINNLTDGLKNFNAYDKNYQIGTTLSLNCEPTAQNNAINYNNDCWDASINNKPNPCKIYVHGDGSNQFNEKVKIRVVWYKPGPPPAADGREIIDVLVTVCDG